MISYSYFRFFVHIVIVIFFMSLLSCAKIRTEELEAMISEIGNKYVPDSRTDIFNVQIQKDSPQRVILKGETTLLTARDAIIEMIRHTGYKIVDSLKILPISLPGMNTYGVVCVSVANIRSKPSHSAELSTQAIMGTPIEILKKEKGWLMIRTPDRYIGWTNDSSVKTMSESDLQKWNSRNRIIFTGMHGMINSEDGTPVSDLVAGSIVVVEETGVHQLRVSLPDGRTGLTNVVDWFSFEAWADTIVPREKAIIDCAIQFIGIPYMWGGTSSKAFDCSGFTKTVYFLNGLILERDASQQVKHGLAISSDASFTNHLPGDLLFFGSKDPFRIIHTGIWKGDNRVIHASGMVKIESIIDNGDHFSSYLSDTYIESRRLIGQSSDVGFIRIKDHPWYINN